MLQRYSFVLLLLVLASCKVKKTQNNPILLKPLKISSKNKIFRTNPAKIIDILHTELNVSFDWQKHLCYGKESILFTPYYYDIDSFTLDAKNFEFNNIDISHIQTGRKQSFKQKYDGKELTIHLNNSISRGDSLLITLDYLASPDKNISNGSAAITDDKGLYFMNTDGKEPFKPMQLWTQGETEANSNWFVTIDKPFEKMTFDINITVDSTLTTLSNGLLIKSTNNSTGKRTDYWNVSQPMSAYLVMMAVGKFNKTYDQEWQGKEVSYYLEPAYHKYAKNIFKHTPEMIEFFSNKIGYDYPWSKYSQVVVRDFVSGAMENTSATLHGDFVQKNDRELIDQQNDGIVAHELFHHWFGDLVTCASWSHLTLNEGFATFGEQLWFGYKYGKTAELKHVYKSMQSYLNYSKRNDKAVVRFYYNDKEELFNPITYQKGARILNLLKFITGEKAFFEAITNYLKKYEFKTAQIENLRHEFEKTSGKDLRYFFNQWFLRGGHPKLKVSWDQKNSIRHLKIEQTQKGPLFSFPFQYRLNDQIININCSKKKTMIPISGLENIYLDPNGIFIGDIENKLYSKENALPYYSSAKNYIEKMDILSTIKKTKEQTIEDEKLLLVAFQDKDPDISHYAMKKINWENSTNLDLAKEDLKRIATLSTHSNQRSQAIYILGAMNDKLLFDDLLNWSQDPSYQVAAAALQAIGRIKPQEAFQVAQKLEPDAQSDLFKIVTNTYAKYADSTTNYFSQQLMRRFGSERNHLISNYGKWAARFGLREQNNFWSEVSQRAKEDGNKWTRFYAMLALNKLSKSSKHITATQKDALLDIFKNEKEGSVKRQLQIYKLLPTESLEK